jgi:hypothetical protein
MKGKPLLLVLALLSIAAMRLGGATAQADGASGETPRFSLEFFGGFIATRPADLNLLADYYNAYPLFFYTGQYEYLRSIYPGRFSYAATRSGDDSLHPIRGGFPGGLRLRYALSRRLSLFLSLEYMEENRSSGTRIDYQIDDRSQGGIQTTPRSLEVSYDGFFLGAAAWVPQAGLRLALPLGRNWQAGGSLSAGPLFARCRGVAQTRTKYLYANGYWSESFYLLDMKGSGLGLAVDLNAEIRRRLTRSLSLFLAAGYGWRLAANVTGPGHDQRLARDLNATQDLVERSWEGRWRVRNTPYLWNGSSFDQALCGNGFGASEADENFVLDLSGFQVKAGLSWAF